MNEDRQPNRLENLCSQAAQRNAFGAGGGRPAEEPPDLPWPVPLVSAGRLSAERRAACPDPNAPASAQAYRFDGSRAYGSIVALGDSELLAIYDCFTTEYFGIYVVRATATRT